jgi:hypothetical protein
MMTKRQRQWQNATAKCNSNGNGKMQRQITWLKAG